MDDITKSVVVPVSRVGEHWQPVQDDELASRIALDFTAEGPTHTAVVLTHTEPARHGAFAATVRSALDGPSPGESLARYADVVARQVTARRED
jgi:hypothetical protein